MCIRDSSYTWPNNFQFRYFNYTKWIGQDSPVYGPFYSISFRSCGENGVRTRDFWRDRPALYPTELTCCFSSLRAMMWDIPVSLTRAERLPGPRPSPIGRHDCSPIRSLTPTFSEIHGIITSLYLLITHFSLPQGRKNRTITELFLSIAKNSSSRRDIANRINSGLNAHRATGGRTIQREMTINMAYQ